VGSFVTANGKKKTAKGKLQKANRKSEANMDTS
jgi:hypothetical protein